MLLMIIMMSVLIYVWLDCVNGMAPLGKHSDQRAQRRERESGPARFVRAPATVRTVRTATVRATY